MQSIRLENVSKSFSGDLVLKDITLTIPGGQFFALLGPSGSGKTTLLRLIAGLESVDSGKIMLGDEDITLLPAHKRRVNTVFQNYALFPHMNVFENVAYGLKIRGLPKKEIEQRVFRMLETVYLEKHAYRMINNLSGGQQQRVALARAIVNEPSVLLFDEPLAALDLKLRERMLLEIIDLQAKLQTTFIYVTHDQLEALTVADQMAIMNQNGEIEQVGPPKQVYEFPVSSYVASFVGTANVFEGVLHIGDQGNKIAIEGLGSFGVKISPSQRWLCNGCIVFMSIRPEKVWIGKDRQERFANAVLATVEAIIYHGFSTQYNVRSAAGVLMQVFRMNEEHSARDLIDYGDRVWIAWNEESVTLLER